MSNYYSSGLDRLRENIEQEYRFKTVALGFDKQSVKDYIEKLREENSSAIIKLRDENAEALSLCRQESQDRLEEMKAQLEDMKNQLSALNETREEIRLQEQQKLEARLNIQEGLVSKLRETCKAKEEENRCLLLQNQELKRKLSENASGLTETGGELSALGDSLYLHLSEKLQEMKELTAAWQDQFGSTLEALKDRVYRE